MKISDSMPRRRSVLIALLIATAVSVLWGYQIEASRSTGLWDFRAIYFGARTAMDHRNPYQPSEFLDVYLRHGGTIPPEAIRERNFYRAVPICVNLPSTLLVVAPLALLGWGPAHLIWMALMPTGFFIAAWLMWDLAGWKAPKLTLILLCVFLANCEIVLQGNAAGIVVSLTAAAVWCLLKRRYETAGVVVLALALAIKPQEAGFVWLALVLAGGNLRRRALQGMAVAVVLGVISVAWISHVAPHWFQQWQSNVAATTGRGDLNDPGPTAMGNEEPGMIVSLQAVISCFRDDPRFYNPAAYLVCGLLLLLWAAAAWRSRGSRESLWIAMASVAALGLLPVYHRHYDCKLLLLMIPAVAALRGWVDPRVWKWAAGITTATIVLSADVPVAVLFAIQNALHVRPDHLGGQILTVLLERTPTLLLLLSGTFYLWMLARLAWRTMPGAQEEPVPDSEFEAVSA